MEALADALIFDPEERLASLGLDAGLLKVGVLGTRIGSYQDALRARRAHRDGATIAIAVAGSDARWLEFASMPLRTLFAERRFGGIVVGTPESRSASERFRALGFRIALPEPFDNETLRFQVNRALGIHVGPDPRNGARVPCALRGQARLGSHVKPVRAYTVSTRGVYLATPQPWPVGSEIELRLELPEGPAEAPARVVHVSDQAKPVRPGAPLGMGAHFQWMNPRQRAELKELVRVRAALLDL